MHSPLALSYQSRVLSAYEGEILGEAFFRVLAEEADGKVRAKLVELAGIEKLVAGALLPLVLRYRLEPKSAEMLAKKARDEALDYAKLGWTEFAVKLKNLLGPFVREFQILLGEAPVEDRPYIQLLLDHEIALFDFAQTEGEESTDGQHHLDSFVKKHKALLPSGN
ncbi:MAG: hypothetical protein EOS41_29805 [Mesorhizobium sp.]|uniref:hypothetical protein n=1 Tax=Mesorhizobium sp. TaxID=1871066 RepID=UPI000FE83E36|nr:hypothetical protein [Mesorhizobium sp.]RWE19818.1 MAG: hypothetical protein EOS41_29805 [Mesorhizobium sp.]